jgi:hypothetical protein
VLLRPGLALKIRFDRNPPQRKRARGHGSGRGRYNVESLDLNYLGDMRAGSDFMRRGGRKEGRGAGA